MRDTHGRVYYTVASLPYHVPSYLPWSAVFVDDRGEFLLDPGAICLPEPGYYDDINAYADAAICFERTTSDGPCLEFTRPTPVLRFIGKATATGKPLVVSRFNVTNPEYAHALHTAQPIQDFPFNHPQLLYVHKDDIVPVPKANNQLAVRRSSRAFTAHPQPGNHDWYLIELYQHAVTLYLDHEERVISAIARDDVSDTYPIDKIVVDPGITNDPFRGLDLSRRAPDPVVPTTFLATRVPYETLKRGDVAYVSYEAIWVSRGGLAAGVLSNAVLTNAPLHPWDVMLVVMRFDDDQNPVFRAMLPQQVHLLETPEDTIDTSAVLRIDQFKRLGGEPTAPGSVIDQDDQDFEIELPPQSRFPLSFTTNEILRYP